MRVGIATDHGGFGLKQELVGLLRAAGHEVVDFCASSLVPADDYPDYVVPMARAVAEGGWSEDRDLREQCGGFAGGEPDRGVRARDPRSLLGGCAEDDHMNADLHGQALVGPSVAWDLVGLSRGVMQRRGQHLRRLKGLRRSGG